MECATHVMKILLWKISPLLAVLIKPSACGQSPVSLYWPQSLWNCDYKNRTLVHRNGSSLSRGRKGVLQAVIPRLFSVSSFDHFTLIITICHFIFTVTTRLQSPACKLIRISPYIFVGVLHETNQPRSQGFSSNQYVCNSLPPPLPP